MANLEGFDATQVTPQSFEPIPAGKYLAVISNSEMTPTKDGSGQYLKLEFDIIEGEYKNRKLWDRLNLKNRNEKTVQIARERLSSICHAVNVLTPKDSVELHNLPLCVAVTIRTNADGDRMNEIKGYASRENAAATSPARDNAAPDQQPPWKKN